MPLRACIDGHEVLAPFISDGDWEALKLQRNKQVVLPCCGADGYLRTSKQSTKHFVHKHKTDCDWKPETWQHLLAKTEIVRVCQRLGYDAKTEVTGSDWRADVLATKPGKQGLIQIAFEVQWSPQTLEVTQDRQAKYKRDGIRGCWFFQRPPEFHLSHDLPVFKLISLNSRNSLVVQTKNKVIPLSQFVEDLLSRRIRFCNQYRLRKTQNVKIVFFPIDCWKCRKQSYIYYLENPYYTCCGEEIEDYCCEIPRRFRPEVIAAVKSFLKTDPARKIRMGEIRTRYSKTVEDSYISFGCYWCNALFGDFYYFGEVSNAIYGDKSNQVTWETQLSVTESNILDYEAHWCYPENGDFCI